MNSTVYCILTGGIRSRGAGRRPAVLSEEVLRPLCHLTLSAAPCDKHKYCHQAPNDLCHWRHTLSLLERLIIPHLLSSTWARVSQEFLFINTRRHACTLRVTIPPRPTAALATPFHGANSRPLALDWCLFIPPHILINPQKTQTRLVRYKKINLQLILLLIKVCFLICSKSCKKRVIGSYLLIWISN